MLLHSFESLLRSHMKSMLMRSLFSVASLAVLGACEGESDATGPGTGTPEPAVNQVVSFGPLNASSTDTLVYFSFASGGLVPRTGDWDLAFRRYEVRLNSPAVGGATSKNVLGFALDNNKTATDAQVLAFTPAATLSSFDAVRAAEQGRAPQVQLPRHLQRVSDARGRWSSLGLPSWRRVGAGCERPRGDATDRRAAPARARRPLEVEDPGRCARFPLQLGRHG